MKIPGKSLFETWEDWQNWVTGEVERVYKGATIKWDIEGNPTLIEHYEDKVYKGKSRSNNIMEYVIDLSRGYGVKTTFFPDQAEIT